MVGNLPTINLKFFFNCLFAALCKGTGSSDGFSKEALGEGHEGLLTEILITNAAFPLWDKLHAFNTGLTIKKQTHHSNLVEKRCSDIITRFYFILDRRYWLETAPLYGLYVPSFQILNLPNQFPK